jgi:hypothetical protein
MESFGIPLHIPILKYKGQKACKGLGARVPGYASEFGVCFKSLSFKPRVVCKREGELEAAPT